MENRLAERFCQEIFLIFSTGIIFKKGTENGEKMTKKRQKNAQKAEKR
jgi:hypothetical protein